MMFGLKINSLSELNMFQQVKLNQTPHSALNLKSMKKFDVDQLMDQFKKFGKVYVANLICFTIFIIFSSCCNSNICNSSIRVGDSLKSSIL